MGRSGRVIARRHPERSAAESKEPTKQSQIQRGDCFSAKSAARNDGWGVMQDLSGFKTRQVFRFMQWIAFAIHVVAQT